MLSTKQKEVMVWLERGYEIHNVYRDVFEVKGKVSCTKHTILSLADHGLIEPVGRFAWRIKCAGVAEG